MAIEIVTGLQEEPHVTPNDIGGFQQGVVGTKDYVLGVGEKTKATLISNNTVRISDGELVMQGVHWRIKPGTYENVTINNGSQGMRRKDVIIARYTKNSDTGIENITLNVLQGEPTSGTPVVPSPTIGDIRLGALKHEMILYVVELNGLNVVGVEPVFEILMSMKEIKDGFGELNSKLFYKPGDKIYVNHYTTGTWTNSGKQLVFSMPCGKILSDDISGFDFESLDLMVRQKGEYCIGTGDTLVSAMSGINKFRKYVRKSSGTLDVSITFGTAYAKENNATCGIVYASNIVFK